MPDPEPAAAKPPAAAAPASGGLSAVPFMTAGGGFAVGLLSMFGIKDLLPTQHALALTVFGLVTCLVLVIAIATVDMQKLTRKDGTTFPLGSVVAGAMAVIMLLIGISGAAVFLREYWVHDVVVAIPSSASAYYSYNSPNDTAPSAGTPAPLLVVNGVPTSLALFDHKPFMSIAVPTNAMIEVRIPTVAAQQAVQHQVAASLAQGAPADY